MAEYKIYVMNDMINHDMINVMNNIDVIEEQLIDITNRNEEPPKELFIILNESQAVLDSLIGMREAGM